MKIEPLGLVRSLTFGAVAGSLLDGFHTHGGATIYPHPLVWMMAWWVPLIFAGAYASGGYFYAFVRERIGRAPPSLTSSIVSFVLFAGLYFSSGFLPASTLVKTAVLLAGGLALWWATDRAPSTLLVGLVMAIAGPTTEIVLVHLDTFSYLHPDVLGIAGWLPALYFASAPGVGPLMQHLSVGANTPARKGLVPSGALDAPVVGS